MYFVSDFNMSMKLFSRYVSQDAQAIICFSLRSPGAGNVCMTSVGYSLLHLQNGYYKFSVSHTIGWVYI